jgi:hypothetical protein
MQEKDNTQSKSRLHWHVYFYVLLMLLYIFSVENSGRKGIELTEKHGLRKVPSLVKA